MALPVRRRDAAPHPVMRRDPFQHIDAGLHDGILMVGIPKPEQRPRRINVKPS